MKAYAPYLHELRRLLVERREDPLFPHLAERAINGEASTRLAELVAEQDLKRSGAFFSSSELSKRVAAGILPPESHSSLLVIDPACGAGNLLLAAARKLPLTRSLTSTLHLWGRHLAGFDLYAEFVQAAQLRLAILAISRGAKFDMPAQLSLQRFFPHIRQGDGLRELAELTSVTHILINPPFGKVTAPDDCAWAKGKVTQAAVFFEQCLKVLPTGARVSAILPDVLRSGSRYHRWRKTIESRAMISGIMPMGNFETADIDVFLLDLETASGKPSGRLNGCWWALNETEGIVGDRFDVHVGAVVPHRLKKNEGPIYPFLHAKELPFWGEFTPGGEVVSFSGTVVRPPFVAVRRTSSPSDRHRALGTIICGKKPVAVENHIVVCLPKSGGLTECRRLLKALQRSETNAFLNQRIRCRHLTVGVVKEIPL